MEAQTWAETLVDQFIIICVPTVIYSDQGRQYENRLLKDLCDILEIRKTRTMAFHPKSDGMVKVLKKSLATMLGTYVSDMAYRSSVHESTGYTPNMLMPGIEVSTPLGIMVALPFGWESSDVHTYAHR